MPTPETPWIKVDFHRSVKIRISKKNEDEPAYYAVYNNRPLIRFVNKSKYIWLFYLVKGETPVARIRTCYIPDVRECAANLCKALISFDGTGIMPTDVHFLGSRICFGTKAQAIKEDYSGN